MSRIDESLQFHPVRIAVLTVSDTRTPGTDKSGDTLVERLTEAGQLLADRGIAQDDRAQIVAGLRQWIEGGLAQHLASAGVSTRISGDVCVMRR